MTPPAARPPARQQALVGAAILVATYAAIFGIPVVNALRVAFGTGSLAAPGVAATSWSDRATALEGYAFVALVAVVVVVRWLPRFAPAVAARTALRWRTGAGVPAGLVGATLAYVTVVVAAEWVGGHLASALHWTGAASLEPARGAGGLVLGLVASGSAAITEELVLIALAAAVADQAFAALGRRPLWALPATLGLLIGLRWLVHLYYLGDSVFVLFWVPAAYLLYRWAGSVWPLVVGHALYDGALSVEQAFPATATPVDRLLWAAAAGGALVLIRAAGRSLLVVRGGRHADPGPDLLAQGDRRTADQLPRT